MIQTTNAAYSAYPPYRPVLPPAAPPQTAYGYALDQMHWMVQAPTVPMAPGYQAPLPPGAPLPVAPLPPAPIPTPSVMGRLSHLVDKLRQRKPTAPKAPKPPAAQAPKPPRPSVPKAPPAPKKPPSDTGRWFISQYRSASNTQEDASRNGNCGPTSLTMVAEAFHKISVTPASANAAIEATRRRMGAGTTQASEYEGTSYEQLLRGAKSYGLDAKVLYGKIDAIKQELAKGRLVIAHVRPDYLFPGTTSGHYTVVTKIEGGKVYLNDSANAKGRTVISEAAFLKAQAGRGTYGLISIAG